MIFVRLGVALKLRRFFILETVLIVYSNVISNLTRIFCLMIFLLVCIQMLAQKIDDKGKELLYKEVRRIQPAGTILYADKPIRELIKGTISCLRKELPRKKSNVVLLSNTEISQIIDQLKFRADLQLPEDLFENSKRVRGNTLMEVVKSLDRILIDSLQKDIEDGYKTFLQLRKSAFYFTKPIYIRSFSLAFVYFLYYNSMGGDHGLRVYQLDQMQWKYVGAVCGGAC